MMAERRAGFEEPDGDPIEWERLAREMRDPLTVAAGRVQLLRRRLGRSPGDPARTATDLEAVEEALARLARLVDRLDREAATNHRP